ncbi:hypothetical protein AB1Y20_007595 [Prymnesium parvum]|uniref:Receptor ligand binding region domain-containing protein n=1 Tax=Prymnesium parvum TaxID=97485 RepID=A0AB34IYD9_PRYPA
MWPVLLAACAADTAARGALGYALTFDGRGTDIASAQLPGEIFRGATGLTLTGWFRAFGMIGPLYRSFALTLTTPQSSTWLHPLVWELGGQDYSMDIFDTTIHQPGDARLQMKEFERWRHFAVAWGRDGGHLRVYLDGVLAVNRTQIRSGYNISEGASQGVYLGVGVYAFNQNAHVPTDSFRGSLDHLQLWTDTLTPTQIQADFETLGSSDELPAPSLKFTFDDGPGNTAANYGTAANVHLQFGADPDGSLFFDTDDDGTTTLQYTSPVWTPSDLPLNSSIAFNGLVVHTFLPGRTAHLSLIASTPRLRITSLPSHGALLANGTLLAIGAEVLTEATVIFVSNTTALAAFTYVGITNTTASTSNTTVHLLPETSPHVVQSPPRCTWPRGQLLCDAQALRATTLTATSQLVTQLAADVIAASSFWAGSVSWHPLQAIGAQDTFEYGDSELAWSPRLRTGDSRGEYIEGADLAPITVHNVTRQFSFSYNPSQTYELSGYTEFIEVKFEEEVFATALRIGENRGMCSVVRIQGRSSTRGDSFVDLWVSDESAEDRASCWTQYDSNQRYRVFAPALCQLSISVDVLRIELDTRSVSDWNEIDFVELTGTRDLIEGVFPANTSSLWYVPDRGFAGEDSLQLTGYACAFHSASSSEPLEVPILVSGSFPPPSPPASFTVPVVRLGILSRMFGTVTDSYVPFSSGASIIRAVVQALREINNKTDGVADHLLPHTTLQFAYRDSRCDAVHGLRGALHLVNSAFGGRGVSAIIGAYCSDASVAASYVAGASSALPLISPATTTPAMSNGIAHPAFLRTIASDAFQAEAIIDVLLNVLNYTAVAMLSSSDACPGYLWFGGDALASQDLWLSSPSLLVDEALRLEVLRGFFGVGPRPGRGELFEEFRIRRRKLLAADESIQGCSQETDDDGTQLWARDHDENSSTPRECIKIDPNGDFAYDGYAYDAAFAVAHALHDLIEVQNRSEVLAPELLATLIERVSFEGVTGLVDFYDASADPNRIYQGDRRVGIWYDVLNYVDNTQALVTVGSWTPCSGGDDCSWSEQWHPVPGVGLTFSTPDNRPPPQAAPQRIREVRIGVLLPMFGTATAALGRISWSPLVGVYQALREINNKSDGVGDALLPHTHLKFAFFDSKCDSAQALQGALHLTQKAFGGDGVNVIVGSGCSAASVTAAQVTTASAIPLISGASTSPTLSDGKGYTFFLRTIPSDAFGAIAIVNMLQRLWNYTSVALAYSTDAYGAGLSDALLRVAAEQALTIRSTVSFVKDAIDFSLQHRTLIEAGSRVIVLLSLPADASRFMRQGLEVGIGGEGYLWISGDASAQAGLWEDDPVLSTDADLRLRVLKGSFAVLANPRRSSEYEAYMERQRRLPPNHGTGLVCNLERDDDGTYLWAQDHDGNASTPLECAGHDLSIERPFDSFTFDAVFAVAHALHDLIEVENRTEIVGSELLDTMIKRVRFEGVTGLVDFYDASADPDRRFHGDRRVGVSYNLLNYVDNVQGLAIVGLWTPCSTGSQCGWSDQWTPSPGVEPVYSTSDNRPPAQFSSRPVYAVEMMIGILQNVLNYTAVAMLSSSDAWPGYLWFGGDALATSALWLGNPTLLSDEALRLEVLRGFFGVSPRPGRGELFEEFQTRRRNFLIADESIQGCSQETDSDGTQLWAQDHDENSSTPRVCIKIDPNSLCPYDGYAYDAAFAVAHALHDLIQVQNRSEVLAPELLATLIERVSFEGVTGLVDFYDASANPNREYHGDRRVGIWYDVLNYVDNTQELVTVGSWTPCSGGDDCSWSEQWHPVPGVGLTFSTPDNRPPPQAAPQRIREVRIGVLLPMFGTATAALGRISWSPLVGVYQALREINNKSDGVGDALLPHTHLKFAFFDSKCDSAQALQGALHLTQKAFGGSGVSMIFGAGCSSASVTAAQVATGSLVPLICGASTSPTLSDGKGYPFFLRTIPSDAFGAVAIVSMLQRLWNYTSVALVFSTDAYGAGIAEAFTRSAFESNLEVTVSVSFVKDAIDFSSQHRALLEFGNRVIALLCLAGDAVRFMRSALEAGIGGDGYIWVGGDTMVGNWEDDAILSNDADLRLRVLKGSFAIIANGRPQASNDYQGYLARRRRLPPNSGSGDSCDLGTDDDGAYLWAQDHDGNASTPLACAGYDLSQDGPYDAFGFDAVFAIAHALHDLIEVENRTEIVGSELLDTMIRRVRFEGVTGLVDFYDASADPDRRFHGDRRVGVSYNLLNYIDNVQKQVNVGLWTPCSTGSQCSWSDQWTPSPGVVPVYSTGGSTPPSQSAFQVVREVRLGVLLQAFDTSAANFRRNIWSPLFGVYHALHEINNKTDGVADGLLPKTILKMAYRDSQCASSEALQASLHLTREAFDGKGVNAMIGAVCSEASITAAQVAAGSHVPMVSPGSTSVALSDGRKYPFFLRTIPADSMSAHAMVEALTSLFNYTKVALVHSTDVYGSDIADEFVRKASAQSLTILTIQRYANDAADFESQQLALRLSGARVIVLYCQASDCGRFMRTAWERDVGGEGYVWCGGDALASSELWENDGILQQDESLRDRILKGLFAFSQETSRNSSEYQGYLARRRRLPPNAGTGESCNLERDDDGAYLWAQDHDGNASTPLACAGDDLSKDGPYDAFGFDAVFAIAHALHHLIEVENRTEIVGSELLDTMIKRVRFEGVTGLVDFYDASADPDRRFHGDRRVGVSYKLLNYVDKARGQVVVGLWTPCYTSYEVEFECNWSDQWTAAADVELTFSTADNRKPQQTAGVSCPYGEVLSYDGSSVLPVLCFVAVVLTPSTATNIFAAWSCETFQLESIATPPTSVKLLRGDLSLTCDQSNAAYVRVLVLAYVLVAIWPIGVPTICLMTLYLHRRPILHGQSTRVVRATSFLFREYDKAYYWWEVLFLVQRLCIVGFAQWLSHSVHRILFGLTVASAFMALQLAVQPYKRSDVGIMAYSSQGATVLFLFVSIFIRQFNVLDGIYFKDTQRTDSLSYQLLGFSSINSLVAALIAVVFTFLTVFVGLTCYHMVTGQDISILRLTATSYPPELSLDKGKRYHLFLSHIWSSGQDQVANIKRKLQLMVPGCQIFLDVDDLDELASLEKHVESSQCVLTFLSKGYFYSANCRREITCAFHNNIPLALVHEADVAKGGVSLETLRLDCESACPEQRELLANGREIIVWHRMADFQQLSLKRIAKTMLQATPLYRELESPPELYLSAELETQVLEFRHPVHLYVSEANRVLLYLNTDTFLGVDGQTLANDVRLAWAAGVEVVLVHENDEHLCGCPFSRFFETTPQELVQDGLYKRLAVPFQPSPYREISQALLALALGARLQRSKAAQVADGIKMNSLVKRFTQKALSMRPTMRGSRSVRSRWSV